MPLHAYRIVGDVCQARVACVGSNLDYHLVFNRDAKYFPDRELAPALVQRYLAEGFCSVNISR